MQIFVIFKLVPPTKKVDTYVNFLIPPNVTLLTMKKVDTYINF